MHQFDRTSPLNRVRTILAGAIILPEQERARFIEEESGGNQAIISEVQSLIRLHNKAVAFFGNSLGELIPAAPEPEQLNRGDLLKDRYRITGKVARSKFSTVYLADDELLLGKRVVIKTPDQISTEREMRLTFTAELSALSELHHPNIAGINDIGILSNGKPFLVLNFVPGQTLAELLSQGPLPRPLIRQISGDLAKALAAAHRSGIFHLDVKPSNVMVYSYGTKDQHVTLIDFGIAKLKNSGSPQFFGGSLNYIAPEQAQLPSAKCDIYSLGLLIFEMLTGRFPSSSRSISAQLPRDLDKSKRNLLSSAINADPLQRPDNAADFIDSLWRPHRVSRSILVSAAAAALVFAAVAFVRPGTKASWYSKPVPLVSTLARELFPSLSADGSQVYYVVHNEQQSVICKRLIIGGEPEIISVSPLKQYTPKPSNSGEYLAWIRSKQDGKMQLIRKMLPAGTEEVIADSLDVDDFTWTPDDRYLILSTRDGPLRQELRRLDLETRIDSGLSLPGSPACGAFHPAVSRDGQSLAFACRWRRGSDDLFTAKANTDWSALGQLKQVTRIGERIESLQWVPDGNSILYIAGPLGYGTLRRIWVDNPSRIESLPELGDRLNNITVASKVWKAAFGRDLSDTNLWLHSTSNKDRPIQIADSSYEEEEGSWSPDGTRMAFSSRRSGSQQLWVTDANGKEAKQITHIDGADGVGGMWTPDSKELVVSITDGNGSRIGLISPIRGTHMKDLYKGGVPLSFSQDGRWIYFLKQEIGQEVWRLPFPGGGAQTLVQKPATYALESPDGRYLYFSGGHGNNEVWRRPMAGGPSELVLRPILRRSLFALSSKGIYFVAPPEEPHKYPSLRFRDNQGNSAIISQLAHSIGWGMSLSPDERQIMLTHAEIDNDDIMLIDQFR